MNWEDQEVSGFNKKVELLEQFDKLNNGTYKLDDLAELILYAYEAGQQDVAKDIKLVADRAVQQGIGVPMDDPRFQVRLFAHTILNTLPNL